MSHRTSQSQGSAGLSTPTPPTHVQAIHDFDPSLLASTSSTPSNLYLTFKAGEIIRVHVRDATGWWDGEISAASWAGEDDATVKGVRRGWFPSNYVREMGWDGVSKASRDRTDSQTHRRGESSHSRRTSTASHHSRASTTSVPSAPSQTLLQPIVQSLSLLDNAIHANHKSHIQPSTACVISSIRAALMQTDCLSKESPTLVQWPVLAKERKIVLVELSKLVACARSATEVTAEVEPPKDLEALAKAARGVFASVKRFLSLASDCGVEVIPIEADSLPSPQGGNPRLQQAFRLRATSVGDLRAARQRGTSPPPPLPSATYSTTSSSPTSGRSHDRQDSNYSQTSEDGTNAATPLQRTASSITTDTVLDSIGAAEDALLSIIAAFIGHIHSHSINSHPSSHAHLIEMTREAVDSVRELLTIVEAVGRNASVRHKHPREIDFLRMAKDQLYEIASNLVESAEVVAHAPFSETGEDRYDTEKARLLQTATGTLRAGTECVRLVRLCLPEDDTSHVTPRQYTPGPREKPVGARGVHTLSGLHRKATSLSNLQKRYLQDGSLVQAPREADEDEEGDDEELVEDVTLQPPTSLSRDMKIRPPDLLRTQSEAGPRSRSTSLSSPAPPRIQHRSPSRSADLDKFTSDFAQWDLASKPPADVASLRAASGALSKITSLNDKTPPRPTPTRSATAPDPRFWAVSHDYDPREIVFNSDGNMIGASLSVLVEKMTPHDGPVDVNFHATFFYTFRLFTTPSQLLDTVVQRYNLQPPAAIALNDRERAVWVERKIVPIRLRIYNFLKSWLDQHWRSETDDVVLPSIEAFAQDIVCVTLPAMGPRLLDTVRRRLNEPSSATSVKRMSTERSRGLLHPPTMPVGLPPTPVISKSLHSVLQRAGTNINITDFDTLELARQFTVMESKLFCAVTPEDLLQTGKKTIPELKALSTLSNQITGWVADSILNETDAKKRAGLMKFFIKLADVSQMVWNPR
ncbi:hypothetical protein CI109_102206 [Kwoniella shandongensis]|uniref:SH3 domain-containing protein n=1 Tax=Kwoniella shandongensis TaxID=1734106 RepID=A0AAJ8MUA1_9TREE